MTRTIYTVNLAKLKLFTYLCGMDEFKEFIAKAKRLGLCQEYTEKVDKAASKKQFMDICLDANGMNWLSHAIARWHGLSAEYISREFHAFNEGRYVRNKDGYTSAMYCSPTTNPEITTTAAIVINHFGKVHINRPICELYIVNSSVEIDGDGQGVCYLYNSEIKNNATAPVIIKEDNTY